MILIKKSLIVLIQFLLTSLALASYGSADEFYFHSDDLRLPEAVRTASHSVVALKSVAGFVRGYIDLSTKDKQEKMIEWAKAHNQFYTLTQMEFCIQHYISKCPQFTDSGEGSAFFLGDSKTLATTLHNSIWYIQAFNSLKNYFISPKVLDRPVYAGIGVEDHTGHLLYSWPKDIGGQLTLSFITTDLNYISFVKRPSEYQTTIGRNFDYTELKFEKETPFKPLFLTKDPIIPGDLAYIIGFPMNMIKSSLAPDQLIDNDVQRVSLGKIISTEEFLKIADDELNYLSMEIDQIKKGGGQIDHRAFRKYKEFILDAKKHQDLLNRHALFIDGECSYGNSGGPIVNDRGEVLAVLQEVFLRRSQYNKSVCIGLKNISHELLLETWNGLRSKSSTYPWVRFLKQKMN